jgi:hypothetical protein
MFCVLELTAMKEEVAGLHSEPIKDSISPFYQPVYDLLLGLHDVKRHILLLYIYIYINNRIFGCVCVSTHTYTLIVDR